MTEETWVRFYALELISCCFCLRRIDRVGWRSPETGRKMCYVCWAQDKQVGSEAREGATMEEEESGTK